MEEHNNKLIGQLGNKVHSLKNLAIDIQSELRDQDKTLDEMVRTNVNTTVHAFKGIWAAMS